MFLVVFRDDDLVAELCAMTSSAEDVTDEEAAYGVCRSIVISLSSELVIIDAFFCSCLSGWCRSEDVESVL